VAISSSLILLAAGGGGCGGDSGTSTTTRAEVAQNLPKLPSGWRAHRDDAVGFALGVPPGWKVRARGGKVLIRSPDHLVAVTLAVDRNGDALELPPAEFATRALAALPGFRARLRPSPPNRFGGTPLRAVETTAAGTPKRSRLKERATVLVLRRDDVVNYTVAIVANAEQAAGAIDLAMALQMARTIRDQPVQTAVAPG
jgi:hypothetical protein